MLTPSDDQSFRVTFRRPANSWPGFEMARFLARLAATLEQAAYLNEDDDVDTALDKVGDALTALSEFCDARDALVAKEKGEWL